MSQFKTCTASSFKDRRMPGWWQNCYTFRIKANAWLCLAEDF